MTEGDPNTVSHITLVDPWVPPLIVDSEDGVDDLATVYFRRVLRYNICETTHERKVHCIEEPPRSVRA